MPSGEVRLAVQRAIDKLITRFGTTGEVIGELRAALKALDKAEAPASEVVKGPETAPEPTVADEQAEPPLQPRRGMGRKK